MTKIPTHATDISAADIDDARCRNDWATLYIYAGLLRAYGSAQSCAMADAVHHRGAAAKLRLDGRSNEAAVHDTTADALIDDARIQPRRRQTRVMTDENIARRSGVTS